MLRSIGKQEYVPVTNNCSRSNCKHEYCDAIRITDIRSAAAVIALAAMTVMPIDSVTLQSSITVTRHLHPALPPPPDTFPTLRNHYRGHLLSGHGHS